MGTVEDVALTIGVDIGGTFTDAVLSDGKATWRAKATTTSGDLGGGVMDACALAASRYGASLESVLPRVRRFGLGTTAVTNVIASRAGRRVGLLVTKGFEDTIPLSRLRRVEDGGFLSLPPQLVERRAIAGVRERIDRNGEVLTQLEPAEVKSCVRYLVDSVGIDGLAISFLWSFQNDVHEALAAEIVTAEFPGLDVTCGSQLLPVIREYERTTFALLNAYATGAVTGIGQLARKLADRGMQVPLLLVHSGGGMTTIDEARRTPASLVASGPAAGVAAAAEVSAAAGAANAMTCDIGGTSFDFALITDGQPSHRRRGELMGMWTAMTIVDVDSVGAGGGSVGWTDARGMLRVGPRSAGSQPGPACYRRGGKQPTVTDALLVLGYIDPECFLGGEMTLDLEAARNVCRNLGRELQLGTEQVAWGIREIALAEMVKAVRSRLAARGLDPRTMTVISYGGCGGLFSASIAEAIGSSRVLIPASASVLSAVGAAVTDIRRERTRTIGVVLPDGATALAAIARVLGDEVDKDLEADGVAIRDRSISFEAEMRFRRQSSELAIPLRDLPWEEAVLRLIEDFREEYASRYGEGSLLARAGVECGELRAIGIGRTVKASLGGTARQATAGTRPSGRRLVSLSPDRQPEHILAVPWSELSETEVIVGPAVIDNTDTTVWVPADWRARLDSEGTLALEGQT